MLPHLFLQGILPRCTTMPTLARTVAPHMQFINLRGALLYSTTEQSPLQWLTNATCEQHGPASINHSSPAPQGPSLNAAEVNKFAQLADTWWDPVGPFAGLQRMNPARCRFIKDAVCHNFGYVGATLGMCCNWHTCAHCTTSMHTSYMMMHHKYLSNIIIDHCTSTHVPSTHVPSTHVSTPTRLNPLGFEPLKGISVLDVGCGGGLLAEVCGMVLLLQETL